MDELPLDEFIEHVPEAYWERYASIVGLIDAFCDEHLDDEYKQLCRELAVPICQQDSPAARGKPESWACGVVYTIGRVNFLSDPATTPCLASTEIAKGFGVSEATMHAKARIIREGLDITPLHPDWCLPSKLEDNPLVWMLSVNGFIMDIRTAPLGAQEEALRQGLIPFIPDARGITVDAADDELPEGIVGRIEL